MASTTTRPLSLTGQPLTYSQLKQLWIQNGGPPAWASTMAGVALAESGGRYWVVNNNPDTKDYSVGLWQINYFGALLGPRTAAYGSPEALKDPNANAKAAISLLGNGSGISNWAGDPVGQVAINNGSRPLSDAQIKSGLGGGPLPQTGPLAGSSDVSPSSVKGCDSSKTYLVGALNQCQVKALKGGLFITAGGAVMLIGIAFMLGKRAKLPGPLGVAAGFVGGEARANRKIRQSKVDTADARATAAAERAGNPRRVGSASASSSGPTMKTERESDKVAASQESQF